MSKLNKRIMSAILAFILFMTNIPVVGSADNSTFAITYEGETVKKVEFYNHEKITVTAENIPEGSHQWQIKIPGTEQWVNIHGQTDAEIGLSYAVVGSLLVDDSAYVRCAAISEGLEIAHTATLRVTVKEEPVRQEPVYVAPVIEATEAPVEETEAPVEETEAPVEETEAPIEETEAPVEETEAPIEETEAPVEETEAPVEETEAPIEETEAPVEETEAPVEATEAPIEKTEAPVEETEAPVEAAETPAEPVVEVPAAPAEEESAAPVAETEAVIEEPAAPVAETEAVTEETEEATEATAEPTEAPKKTSKKSSKKSSEKATPPVTNQKTESVTPKAAGTDDIELVSVTINYVYWDRHHKQAGNQAWDPTVANIVKGSNYSNTVVNKIIPGYKTTFVIYDEDGTTKLADGNPGGAQLIDGNYEGEGEPPEYDPDEHTSSAVKIDLASVNENIVYTVYYQEIEVPYTARYFLQNVYNDLYSENTDLPTAEQQAIMKGYQNTEPDPNEIYVEIPGFTALFHQPDQIAADGSTVFEVYYDRNYYLINFDMDGGYGTAPVYARFETAFSVSNPTKAGYKFNGWKLTKDGDDIVTGAVVAPLPNKIPAVNQTYKADWAKEQVKYTVAYWILDDKNTVNTADDVTTFLGSRYGSALSGEPVDGPEKDLTTTLAICGNPKHDTSSHEGTCYVNATDLRYMDFVKADQDVIVEGDGSTVVNVYYKYREYTLKFYYAMTSGSGTDTKYYVVGGSTYGFGADESKDDGTDRNSEISLLSQYLENGGWRNRTGSASEMPTLNALGVSRKYTTGSDSATVNNVAYQFHYISFKARYGDDISKMWPCGVFNSVTMNSGSTSWSGSDEAFVSAWNGEYNVYYSQVNKGNQTIKGNYEKLDYQLLWQNGDPDDLTVSYLCFWENGDDIGWSVPELYIYNIWVTCLLDKDGNPTDLPTDPQTNKPKVPQQILVKGYNTETTSDDEYKWFYLDTSYHTCDNSTIGEQTRISLTGFSGPSGYRLTNWKSIFINDATLKDDGTYQGAGGTTYNPAATKDQVNSGGWKQTQTLTPRGPDSVTGKYLLYDATLYDPDNPIDGVNHANYLEAFTRDFYYYRNTHTLNFWNVNDYMVDGEGEKFQYGASLRKFKASDNNTFMTIGYTDPNTGKKYGPYYPDGLEPNAYTFEGWYTTADCLEGTKVDWENMTMPDNDLTVYANWQPITHDTYFYLDYDRYQKRDPSNPTDPNRWYFVADTDHGFSMKDLDQGKILPTQYVDADGNKKDYRFVGWFYLDENGEKVAFNPAEMAVRKELHLYAEWTSTVSKQYTVQYFKGKEFTDGSGNKSIKIVDASENEVAVDANTGRPVTGTKPVKLADNLNGYAFESTTKTFDAKSKDKLNLLSKLSADDQNALWLPHTNSHSIVMKSLESDNYFAFIYVRREFAPYKVRYVDAATGQEIKTTVEYPNNKNAVVTEQFKYIHGYIPNSFYETLILSANEEENVITFYYTKDTTVDPGGGGTGSGTEDKNARYYIAHYVLNTEGTAFELYTSDSPVAPIDTEISADRLDISGIEFVPSYELDEKTYTSVEKGIVKSGKDEGENKALILELYYVRQKYSYTVQYFKHGTTTPVKPTETRETIYPLDKVVEESAPPVEGYELSSESKKTLKISSDTTKNVITFYYTPQPLTVNYVAVCPDNRGSDFAVLTKEKEVTNEGSGKIVGSQAIPKSGFWFKGWYADEEGNVKIQDTDTLKPQIENHPGKDYAIAKDYGEYTYYALFEPIKLKITQTGMRDGAGTSHMNSCVESGVYELVKHNSDDTTTVIANIILTGNDFVIVEQVPAGKYSVRPVNGWTWTYNTEEETAQITVTGSDEIQEIVVERDTKEVDWLHDEATQ